MKRKGLKVILISIFLVISVIGGILYYLENNYKSILVYGLESSSVKIVNFTSFQCPPCRYYHETFGPILEKYIESGDIQLIIKPIDLGKFEYDGVIYEHLTEKEINDYHELLKIYETQDVWREFSTENEVIEYLGLNDDINYTLTKDLKRNNKEKQKLNLEGVPTTFINGEQLPYDLTAKEFENKIIKLISELK